MQGSYFGPAGTFDDRIDAIGTAGAATVAGCEAYFEAICATSRSCGFATARAGDAEPVTDSWDASVARSVDEALTAFAGGRAPVVGATVARDTVAVIEAAYRSAESGERVEVVETSSAALPRHTGATDG